MIWNILAGQSVAFALTIVVSVLITMGIMRALAAKGHAARKLRVAIADAEEWYDIAEDYVCQIRELRAEIARLEAKKGEPDE